MSKSLPCRLGLAFAGLLALFHAGWAALVALGWAQPLIDWIFWLHFITPFYKIQPFEFGRAVMLVAFTGIVGYVMGWVLGWLWETFGKMKK